MSERVDRALAAGHAEGEGHRIRFLCLLLGAFPLMPFSVMIASVYVHMGYL